MNQQLNNYHTYILRFWKEPDDAKEGGKWRFTLLDPTKGHRYGFSSIDDLLAFLNSQVEGEG